MKKRILFYGVGTFKNRGVEALVQSTLKQIDKTKYDVSIATFDYDLNKNFYAGKVKYIKHYKKSDELNEDERKLEEQYKKEVFDYDKFELLYQKDVVKEMESSDICISIGGDNYCYDYCTWLYSLDKRSHQNNKKTILWGASLFEEINDLELINDLTNFDVLVMRESISYNAVKKILPEEKLILTADPAFGLEKKKVEMNKWYKDKKYIILNISPLTIKTESQFAGVIKLVKHILKDTEYSICLLPHVTTDDCNDLDGLTKLKEKFKNEKRVFLEKGNYNCNELKYIISKSELVVTARTHASIAAYSTCVPTLVIGYSVKSKGIAKDIFGTYDNYVISASIVKDDILCKKFDYINENKAQIKAILEEKIPIYNAKAKNIFNQVLEKLTEQEQSKICSHSKCIGCGLCKVKCPKEAIEMSEDENGFIYPKIDLTKCIHCDLCRKSCPINKHEKIDDFEKEVYISKNKKKDELLKSTSGGVCSIFGKEVLQKRGIVYGCEMDNFNIQHVRLEKEDDLSRIRGSKYVQSNIVNILPQIEFDLKANKKVLFTGTPCQVGAIKNFLGKDYPNLITVSVICHGVLNQKLFQKYINEIERENNGKITNYKFRSKENGWMPSCNEYEINNEKYVKPFTDDPIMYLYLKNLILRNSCYKCQYKGNNNVSDLIVGDYWGVEITNPEIFDNNGISCLIVNTKKGKEFLRDINFKKIASVYDGNYEDIIKYNSTLINSVDKPKERILALKEVQENNFDLVYKIYKKNYENKELLDENKSLKAKIEELAEQSDNLNLRITQIYNSKRWKFVDKLFNLINKLRPAKSKAESEE